MQSRTSRLTRRTAEELAFGHNGASIRVATSMRGGTIHRLHVSEMGKIGARFPEKAREIVTGSIPAVPEGGIVIVESTAEGASGRFYEMVKRAKDMADARRPLTTRDWRLHFFAWWEAPEYRLDPQGVLVTDADHAYFTDLQARLHITLDERQRAWYAATLGGADFAGERPLMWQEYPSDADEPFRVPREGCYYTAQLSQARQEERIVKSIPVEPGVPVNTFWDIGSNDNTAIWLHQRVGVEERFVGFHKASGEPLAYFVKWLLDRGMIYGRHFLPHDAAAQRQGTAADRNLSVRDMLQELLPGHRFEIVERIAWVLDGIQQTRQALASCWFDEAKCAEGLRDLDNYRKAWDERRGTWRDAPFHGPESDAADAFRQFGQARASGLLSGAGASAARRPRRRRVSPWAV
ncbi:MAG: terminase [Burkholderiaceae bacterium]|nr:terminase [Burkholderiaceae bacterium]